MNIHSAVWRSISRLQYLYPDEVNEICHKIGISQALLANHNLTLPVALFLNFFIEAEKAFPHELVSINYARMAQIRPNYSEILGMIFLYSPNLKESFELVQSYISLELEGINLKLVEKSETIEIHFNADTSISHPDLYENLCLSIFATFIQSMHHPIKSINTKIIKDQKTGNARSLFQCPIHFKAENTALVLTREVFLKQSASANPKLVSLLAIMAKEKIAVQVSEGNIINRLEDIFNSFESHYNSVNMNEVSNLLGISINSLRRKLSKHQTTFRQSLNDHKLKKAKSMLDHHYSTKRAAYALGYTEPSAFIRWFINQTQHSPKTYKKLKSASLSK